MKHPFRWMHGLLIVIGLAVCGLLASARSGHPPGVMFLPVAVAVWLAIHLFLGLVQVIATRGRQHAQRQGMATGEWPVVVVLIVIACSTFFLYSLAGTVEWWRSNEAWRPHRNVYLFLQLVAFVCLCGILLRRNWGRLVTAGASLMLSILFVASAGPAIISGRNMSVGLVLYALIVTAGFALLGVYLLRSARIKAFFSA